MQGDKHIILDALIPKATKLSPYLDYIFDKEIAIQEANQSVTTIRERLNKNPVNYAINAIYFLNGLTKEELRTTNITNMISIITWDRKVVKQHHYLYTIEAKIIIMEHEVKYFIEMFNPLVKMGCHSSGRKRVACCRKKNIMTG